MQIDKAIIEELDKHSISSVGDPVQEFGESNCTSSEYFGHSA